MPSTTEILALKILGETTSEMWVAWAVEMLMAGFDGEYLVELAGISPPFNGWEMDVLVAKVLKEQKLDNSDEARVIEDYVCYLVNKVLAGEIPILEALSMLKDLYYYGSVEFAKLYWAKEDLLYSEVQWYWPNATRENIDTIILEFFQKWQAKCRQGLNGV